MKRIALVALLSLASLGGCTTNQTTGRSQFNAMSRDQEIALGAEAKPGLVQEMGGEVAREDVKAYVKEVGMKLAASTEGDNPSLPWEFTLLDSDVINAFALPGGKVFMSRGLATKMKNEAQLASVLGHEVGHVTARHINDRMADSMWVSAAAGIASVLLEDTTGAIGELAPQVVQLGGQSVLMRFNRKQELEADSLGVRYMVKNDYDPTGALGVICLLYTSDAADE